MGGLDRSLAAGRVKVGGWLVYPRITTLIGRWWYEEKIFVVFALGGVDGAIRQRSMTDHAGPT